MPLISHGMRIASLWVGEPRTLDDIAMSLDIEKAEVYSFYSAAVATSLAGPAKRQVDGLNRVVSLVVPLKGMLRSAIYAMLFCVISIIAD